MKLLTLLLLSLATIIGAQTTTVAPDEEPPLPPGETIKPIQPNECARISYINLTDDHFILPFVEIYLDQPCGHMPRLWKPFVYNIFPNTDCKCYLHKEMFCEDDVAPINSTDKLLMDHATGVRSFRCVRKCSPE